MRLNHDCMRDLLLYLESNLTLKSNGLNQHVKLSHITDSEELESYDPEDIYYSASKLVEGKFITVTDKNVAPRCFYITDITWNGHDYLNSIRDPIVWNKVKEKTSDLSNVAFEIIKALAVDIAKNMFGLA